MIEHYYSHKGIQIYLGDYLKLTIKHEPINLLLTDPPYNAKNIGPNKRVFSKGPMQLPENEYKKFCNSWFNKYKLISKNVVFTPGIANICFYPQPYWVICWHKPASVSYNRMGGYNAWEPIFVYGKMPKTKRLGQDYLLYNTLNFSKGPEKNHPCPKPLNLIEKLVDIFSNVGDLIFDPFMGSGTTLLAAKRLGRKAIGIEMNKEYCDIAIQRLGQEELF